MSKPTADLPELGEFLPLVFGFAISSIAGTTARLGVPDLLGDSAKTADELAGAVGADPRSLLRLLRAATAVGILTQTDGGLFELTPLGRIYRSDSPWQAAVHDAVHSHPAVWRAFGAIEDAVRSGRPAFDVVHQTGFFDYLKRDPQLAADFHASMATNTTANNAAIIDNYDFSRFDHVVDVGGGNGSLLSAVLAAHPGLRGTVIDTALALEEGPAVLRQAGVSDRCELVAGDFFTSVPADGDAYLVKNVLHDWDNESCVRILQNIRSAMGAASRVVVLGSVMPEGKNAENNDEVLALAIQDMAIMAICSGATRTVSDYERLFTTAGLRLGAVTPLHESFSFYAVEGLPR
jgi:hypothetical protein